MKRQLFFLCIAGIFFAGSLQAQKKVTPVSQSDMLGVLLPAGTKKDSRFLSQVTAKALLEMESKKANAPVRNVEILSLPSVKVSGFNADSLIDKISALGWNVMPLENDEKYAWLQRDNRFLIIYFSMDKNSTELYTGEIEGTPSIVMNAVNVVNTQTTEVQQPVQQNVQQAVQQTAEQPAQQIQNPVPPQNTSAPVSQPGFAYSTTNFDNGWTSSIYDDYVLATKGNIKVYLSYIEKFNASDFSGTGKQERHYYWDNYVSKYFTTGDKVFDNGGALSNYSQRYIEGWATDKQTGEKRYIGMMVNIIAFTGTLSIIIASAPDNQQLRQQFPKADMEFENDLLPMYGYNKFPIGKNDLPGTTWVSGGKGATMTWYSTTTGNDVGSTGVATSDVFHFNTGGKYSSTHNGASGWVGAMNTFQQEYKGNYTVTDWTITATNRWEGKTDKYDAWFEIVRGGRVLHMNGSTTMQLFKEK